MIAQEVDTVVEKKFKVGQVWETRDSDYIQITAVNGPEEYCGRAQPIEGHMIGEPEYGDEWCADGSFVEPGVENDHDLITLIHDTPTEAAQPGYESKQLRFEYKVGQLYGREATNGLQTFNSAAVERVNDDGSCEVQLYYDREGQRACQAASANGVKYLSNGRGADMDIDYRLTELLRDVELDVAEEESSEVSDETLLNKSEQPKVDGYVLEVGQVWRTRDGRFGRIGWYNENLLIEEVRFGVSSCHEDGSSDAISTYAVSDRGRYENSGPDSENDLVKLHRHADGTLVDPPQVAAEAVTEMPANLPNPGVAAERAIEETIAKAVRKAAAEPRDELTELCDAVGIKRSVKPIRSISEAPDIVYRWVHDPEDLKEAPDTKHAIANKTAGPTLVPLCHNAKEGSLTLSSHDADEEDGTCIIDFEDDHVWIFKSQDDATLAAVEHSRDYFCGKLERLEEIESAILAGDDPWAEREVSIDDDI